MVPKLEGNPLIQGDFVESNCATGVTKYKLQDNMFHRGLECLFNDTLGSVKFFFIRSLIFAERPLLIFLFILISVIVTLNSSFMLNFKF